VTQREAGRIIEFCDRTVSVDVTAGKSDPRKRGDDAIGGYSPYQVIACVGNIHDGSICRNGNAEGSVEGGSSANAV
jgi:hypothetical protein